MIKFYRSLIACLLNGLSGLPAEPLSLPVVPLSWSDVMNGLFLQICPFATFALVGLRFVLLQGPAGFVMACSY